MPGEPKVLLESAPGRPRSSSQDVSQAWRWVTWFSLALTIAGIGDWILAWIPLRIGTPEWEFGTIVASFSGLPLVTMGFAGLLGSAVARGLRRQIIAVSVALLVLTAAILGALVLFILDVPVALAVVTGIARVGIIKATAKTLLLGLLFPTAYLVAAISALRYASRHGHL